MDIHPKPSVVDRVTASMSPTEDLYYRWLFSLAWHVASHIEDNQIPISEFAEKTGLSVYTITNVMRGNGGDLTLFDIARIAAALPFPLLSFTPTAGGN
jgi:transcriptional regulator with XRE-family HTH domain